MHKLLLFSLGFFAFVFILQFILTLRIFLGVRCKLGSFTLKRRDETPAHLIAMFEDAEKKLNAHGFQFSNALLMDDIFVGEHHLKWGWVFFSPMDKTYAHVMPAIMPTASVSWQVEFRSFFSSGRGLLTVNGVRHGIAGIWPDAELQDFYCDTVAGQWQKHRERLRALETSETFKVMTPEEHTEAISRSLNLYVTTLVKDGYLKPVGDGVFVYALKRIAPIVLRLQNGNQKFAEMRRRQNKQAEKAGVSVETPVEVEVESFFRIKDFSKSKNKTSMLSKWILLIGSLVVFSLSFGFTLSWQTLVILIAVLFFHELGHIVGMIMFGYKDLQILFVPFLGALATGSAKNVKAWQKAVVFLLGPAPGIFLGSILLSLTIWSLSPLPGSPSVASDNKAGILYELGGMLLAINHFNLLPIMPLDGGQLFNVVLLQRFPRLAVLFSLLSALGMAMLALFLSSVVLGIVSLIMFMGVPFQWKSRSLLAEVQKYFRNAPVPPTDAEVATQAFAVLRQQKFGSLPYERRFQLVKQIVENVHSDVSSFAGIALSLFLYFVTAVVLPIVPALIIKIMFQGG